MKKHVNSRVVINILVTFVFLMPLYWTVVTAFKSKNEIYMQPPTLFPKNLVWDNFINIFTLDKGIVIRYLSNSLITTTITVLVVTFISLLAGYGFSKLRIKGKNIMLMMILAAIMIPFHALLSPLYSTMSMFNLLNTRTSLVLIYVTFQIPFGIYMMKNAFDTIPTSLQESAMLDGAGEFETFLKIMAPLTWSSIATVAIFSAYTTWNDYIVGLVFANDESIKTLNVGLTNLAVGQYGTDWGILTAGSLVSLVPIMLLFAFMQRYFIKGMLSGAVK